MDVVSPIASEPLISDVLAKQLEIAVESFNKGFWRFRWKLKEIIRKIGKKEF
ncbi:MAG: hypothetical protein QW743_08045 [Candidatus Methanomethylicia archaeon]